jgi:hypothetical protein
MLFLFRNKKTRTKAKRHELYKQMLHAAENNLIKQILGLRYDGFCAMIYFGFNVNVSPGWRFKLNFPELYAKKPITQRSRWFWFSIHQDGWQQRIELLKQCIKETE